MASPGIAELSFTVEVPCKKYCQPVSATRNDGLVQIPVRNQPEG